jgi:DNA-binding Xre family transcriptional regulator
MSESPKRTFRFSKKGHVKGVRFETLERICDFLDCQPGDILRYQRTELKGEHSQ